MGQHVVNDHSGWCEREQRFCLSWGRVSALGYGFFALDVWGNDDGRTRYFELRAAAARAPQQPVFESILLPTEITWWLAQPTASRAQMFAGLRGRY